ncbi:GNAT family N-acetyltransferase [Corynebacterium gerontici]|uniref:Acetyltransferase (GNAT) family protein n=1 Tax=Corynebacterium gerontici TaxID=2079234 RepID=A0A3G6IZJ5_9CORY|nr:GNAT family N-acetyltransferase [Corynebacterium gerontici]AZA11117.1 Acetyltransferase (GNAT) family protein [Corynebacterium gerontici]
MQVETLEIPGATLMPWSNLAQSENLDDIAVDLQRSCMDPATQEFTTVPKNYTLNMAFEFLRGDALRWAIMANDRYCGNIEVREDPRGYSVGYNLAPWARGKGLMRAALEAAAQWAWNQGIACLIIEIAPANVASQKVAEAVGAKLVEKGELLTYEYCPARGATPAAGGA